MTWTQEQLAEARRAWNSLNRREGDVSEGILRSFGWTREKYMRLWLEAVYGDQQ